MRVLASTEKGKIMVELNTLYAALANPQVHYDLVNLPDAEFSNGLRLTRAAILKELYSENSVTWESLSIRE